MQNQPTTSLDPDNLFMGLVFDPMDESSKERFVKMELKTTAYLTRDDCRRVAKRLEELSKLI